MGLLQNNKLVTPVQPDKTVKLKQSVERIKDLTREAFNTLLRVQRKGIDEVWNNPDLTPQEVIDALGEDSLKVFQFHGQLTDLIKTLVQVENVEVDLKYPTKEFTIDPVAKTITVGTKTYKP